MINVKSYTIEKEALCLKNDSIPDELFSKYGVNRGLRDINGKEIGRASCRERVLDRV